MADNKDICFKGYSEHLEEEGKLFSPEWGAAVESGNKVCLLEDGHSGDHEFSEAVIRITE